MSDLSILNTKKFSGKWPPDALVGRVLLSIGRRSIHLLALPAAASFASLLPVTSSWL